MDPSRHSAVELHQPLLSTLTEDEAQFSSNTTEPEVQVAAGTATEHFGAAFPRAPVHAPKTSNSWFGIRGHLYDADDAHGSARSFTGAKSAVAGHPGRTAPSHFGALESGRSAGGAAAGWSLLAEDDDGFFPLHSSELFADVQTPMTRRFSGAAREAVEVAAAGGPPGPVRPPVATQRELWGWYFYDFSNGPFFYCAMVFLNLLVTQAAKNVAIDEHGYRLEDDDGDRCVDVVVRDSDCHKEPLKNGVLLGIDYASFTQFALAVSVLFQLVVFLTLSAFADFGPLRKRLLVLTNTLGALCCILVLLTYKDSLYWAAGLLMIVANVMYGAAMVFYNAYLPLLVTNHYAIRHAEAQGAATFELEQMRMQKSTEVSSKGFAFGFVGQVINLSAALGLLVLMGDGHQSTGGRLVVALAGAWSLFFGAVSFSRLLQRPGPPLPKDSGGYVTQSISQLKHTLSTRHSLPELFKFLLAYFIYSDGHSTVAQVASVFALVELRMDFALILLGLIETSLLAVFGCWFFFRLRNKYGVSGKTIIFINIALMCIIPIYAVVALTHSWEFFLTAGIFGFNTGSLQAFTRSLYSDMIPEGKESEYFGFFEVTDKGTAWAGPLTVALVRQATGSYRYATLSIIFFLVVGGFLLARVDIDKGVAEGLRFRKHRPTAAGPVAMLELGSHEEILL